MSAIIMVAVACFFLWLVLRSYRNMRAIQRAKAEERKRPPVYCDVCHQPNKAWGADTAKRIREVGQTKRKVCEDCILKYKFCNHCGNITVRTFHTFSGGAYCQVCFENTQRSFSSTRKEALAYHGAFCKICGSTRNLQVHHKTYAREGRERLNDLVVLCKRCHNRQHTTIHNGPRGGQYIIRQGKKRYLKDGSDIYQPDDGDDSTKRR